MPYTSLAALVERFGEAAITALTDRADPPAGTPDAAAVDRAIAAADAVIDGYLAGRYALPLAEAQPIVADIAEILTWWRLHTHEPDPKTKADHDLAMKVLDRIAAGAVRLTAAGIEPQSGDGGGVRVTDRERPFTAENMKGFI